MIPFRELNFPELVKDVREIYWDHIEPLAGQRLPTMRKEGILGLEQPVVATDEFKEIARIRKKYPFLDRHMLLFKLRPDFATEIHIDGHPDHGRIKQREVSINIPISGCNELGITEFYSNSEDDFYLEQRFNVRVMKKECTPVKILEYAVKENPFLTCPQIPHRINNALNTEYRITVSWTLDLSWSWEDAVEYFSDKIMRV
jgi:hypothetical protein